MPLRRILRIEFLGAILIILFLAGLFGVFQRQRLAQVPTPPVDIAASGSWYSLYFTDPTSPKASTLRGGPDAALAEAIDAAQYTVDAALYRLDLWSVRDALRSAHRRGIRVRVVTESDHILEPEIVDLEEAGIPVLGDRREHLMHHKFVVIDQLVVWTGSMNITLNGAYRNNNNLIRILSNKVAQNFTREFEEMFVEDRFGALSLADTPYPSVMVDGVPMEVYFSPDDAVADKIVTKLKDAQQSIDFLVYAFTSDEIADAMLECAKHGVQVRGVLEATQVSAAGSDCERLVEAGLEIRLDNYEGSMHHKVIVIDEAIVITGSYNFSQSAEQDNDENVLIMNSAAIAEQYLLEFMRLFDEATPYR
jgi:phosphatidylserine/phosphatidylglycerophosphate/cardiolipin synthase-like enzyme